MTSLYARACRLGGPALAAQQLLVADDDESRVLLAKLRTGSWRISLPLGSPLIEMYRALSIDPDLHPPAALVSVLAARKEPQRNDSKAVGAVYGLSFRLGAPGSTWASATDFAVGCREGVLAAYGWIYRHANLVALDREFATSLQPSVPHQQVPEQVEGGSAALASAFAAALHYLGAPSSQHLAASGCVRSDGMVTRVEDVATKLDALIRECPSVKDVYLPSANRDDVDEARWPTLNITWVGSIAKALDKVIGTPDVSRLAALKPWQAAEQALEYEVHLERGPAKALASTLRLQIEAMSPAERQADSETMRADVVARCILALAACHEGRASSQWIAMDMLCQEMASALENRDLRYRYRADIQALVAATRSGYETDRFEPARALASFDFFADHDRSWWHLEPRFLMPLLGSWSRALALCGELSKARALCQELLELPEERGAVGQRPRNLCTAAEIEYRGYLSGQADALQAMNAYLREAEREAGNLPEGRLRSGHELYISLWKSRHAAACGDVDHARRLAGPLPEQASGRFPAHLMHRFVGEALLQNGARPEALRYLDKTANLIASECVSSERAVLLTASARAVCIRIEDGESESIWRADAEAFLSNLRTVNENLVPKDMAQISGEEFCRWLDDFLRWFPY